MQGSIIVGREKKDTAWAFKTRRKPFTIDDRKIIVVVSFLQRNQERFWGLFVKGENEIITRETFFFQSDNNGRQLTIYETLKKHIEIHFVSWKMKVLPFFLRIQSTLWCGKIKLTFFCTSTNLVIMFFSSFYFSLIQKIVCHIYNISFYLGKIPSFFLQHIFFLFLRL